MPGNKLAFVDEDSFDLLGGRLCLTPPVGLISGWTTQPLPSDDLAQCKSNLQLDTLLS